MKLRRFSLLAYGIASLHLAGCDSPNSEQASPSTHAGTDEFHFASPPPAHKHMRLLVANAFAYLDPKHGLVDPVSGYPLEGWNQDPERGLFLRSFTQVTAIGEWVELLAIIASGQADNPYLSREEALARLQQVVPTLRTDQQDPKLGARGLLVNFLGLEDGARLGPLTQSVVRQDFLGNFGEENGAAIWDALVEVKWLEPQNNNTEGKVIRGERFGATHFAGPLAPYADETTIRRIMDILDERVVLVAYGDNANLTTSVAKAIGALLHESVADRPEFAALRKEMEQFLDAQTEGYRGLIDEPAGMFSFGRDEKTGKFFGWNKANGEWVVGHQDYLVNEFRDPSMFLITRFDLPLELLGNLGFKMKSYVTQDGRTLFTLAPYAGSAFQVFGLDLAIPHLDQPVWKKLLENAVAIELDYAARNDHPGFLSESYSGTGTEYTGEVGMPDIAVADRNRITTAPSLYTLGAAYQIAPEKVNAFVGKNWPVIESLLTDHGPWEGFQTETKSPIEFQTTAHTLSLLLGALGNGPENMRRYLESRKLGDKLQALYESGPPSDLLDPAVEISQWASDGATVTTARMEAGLVVRSGSKATAGILLNLPPHQPANLSGGVLEIRYRTNHDIPNVAIVPKRSRPLGPGMIQNEIITRLPATGESGGTLSIPLPTTPGLADIAVIEFNFGPAAGAESTNFTISSLQSAPAL